MDQSLQTSDISEMGEIQGMVKEQNRGNFWECEKWKNIMPQNNSGIKGILLCKNEVSESKSIIRHDLG